PEICSPDTKSYVGHVENISFEHMAAIVTRAVAEPLRDRSLAIYHEARAHAWARGLVLADTKFEFGWIDGELTLIDEALSPDSSRYWDRAEYEAGRLLSFDKQFVRDWLDASGKPLPPHVHAPLLARRGSPEDLAELRARSLEPIDLVAVTLYPFEERGRTLDDAGMVEEIDIGGVALLRAAAKNHDAVIV